LGEVATQRDDGPISESVWVVGTLVFYIPFAVGALVWIGVVYGPDTLVARVFGHVPVVEFGMGAAVGLAIAMGTRVLLRASPLAERMGATLGRMLGPMSLAGCVALATCSAVGEELVFRAALQPEIGIVWATVAFAAVHVPFERDLWPWPLFALAVGALLAGLFELTGSVVAPVAAHLVINAHNLWLVARRWGAQPEPDPSI
jgi:membrane protease YdiL (CAAX protease family)